MTIGLDQSERFIFKLSGENLPHEGNSIEESQPFSNRVIYFLAMLAGIASIAYGIALGVFSHE